MAKRSRSHNYQGKTNTESNPVPSSQTQFHTTMQSPITKKNSKDGIFNLIQPIKIPKHSKLTITNKNPHQESQN